jgi:hypothetical protein
VPKNPGNILITPSVTTIADGGAVDFVVTGDPSLAGHSFRYTLSGLDPSEVQGGKLTGTVTLNSNSYAVINVGTIVQQVNGSNETLTMSVGPVTANVAVTAASQTVTAVPNPENEGSTFQFTVSTTGMAPGSVTGRTENYTITGPGIAQIPANERSGTVTLDANGNAVVTIQTLATVFSSAGPDPTVTLTLTGIPTVPPTFVAIHEAATQSVTNSAGPTDTIIEGQSVTFHIMTAGVPGSAVVGTVETYKITGPALDDVPAIERSGTIVLDSNGQAVVTIDTAANNFPGNLTFNLFNDGTPITTNTVNVINVIAPPLSITGTVANQHPSAPFINPFLGATITDLLSNQNETVTIKGFNGHSGSPLNGLLIDPSATTDHGHFIYGAYVFTDLQANVTNDLQALQLLPVGHPIQLQVSVTDTAGVTATDSTTSILGISDVHHHV